MAQAPHSCHEAHFWAGARQGPYVFVWRCFHAHCVSFTRTRVGAFVACCVVADLLDSLVFSTRSGCLTALFAGGLLHEFQPHHTDRMHDGQPGCTSECMRMAGWSLCGDRWFMHLSECLSKGRWHEGSASGAVFILLACGSMMCELKAPEEQKRSGTHSRRCT